MDAHPLDQIADWLEYLVAERDAIMARIEDLVTATTALTAAVATSQNTIATQHARIAELEAKAAEPPVEDSRVGEMADQITVAVATLNQAPPG